MDVSRTQLYVSIFLSSGLMCGLGLQQSFTKPLLTSSPGHMQTSLSMAQCVVKSLDMRKGFKVLREETTLRNQSKYFYMNYNKNQSRSQKTVNDSCHKIKSIIAPVKSEEEATPKERSEIIVKASKR